MFSPILNYDTSNTPCAYSYGTMVFPCPLVFYMMWLRIPRLLTSARGLPWYTSLWSTAWTTFSMPHLPHCFYSPRRLSLVYSQGYTSPKLVSSRVRARSSQFLAHRWFFFLVFSPRYPQLDQALSSYCSQNLLSSDNLIWVLREDHQFRLAGCGCLGFF